MTEQDQSRDRPGDQMARITVAEAAMRIGISEAGVRKRVQRDQITHERDQDGRLWVWVSPGETRRDESHDESRDKADPSRDDRYTRSLEEQVQYLRGQLDQERTASAELRQIVAGLSQANAEQARTIRAIEAPAADEPPEDAETVDEAPEGTSPRSAAGGPQTAAQSPQGGILSGLRRRIFGG